MKLTSDGYHIHQGYIYIKCPNHPRTNKDGFVKRGVLELEKKLDRYMVKGEDVHHVNNDRSDDSQDNLIALTHPDHTRLHHPLGAMRNLLQCCIAKGHPFWGNRYVRVSTRPSSNKERRVNHAGREVT